MRDPEVLEASLQLFRREIAFVLAVAMNYGELNVDG